MPRMHRPSVDLVVGFIAVDERPRFVHSLVLQKSAFGAVFQHLAVFSRRNYSWFRSGTEQNYLGLTSKKRKPGFIPIRSGFPVAKSLKKKKRWTPHRFLHRGPKKAVELDSDIHFDLT